MIPRLKKLVKRAVIIIGLCIGFVLLYLTSAYILSRIAVNDHQNQKDEITIYILSNGVHTDLVLPIKTELIHWDSLIKFEHITSKDHEAKYVAFGWGDKGFYLETPTWDDLTLSTAFKASFGLSTSAMHTTFYKHIQEHEKCKPIKISRQEYQQLIEYIRSSFQKNDTKELIHIKTNANYGNFDSFYEAQGRYNLFFTCNTWANNGLKSCGQKACLWTPFDTGIFYHYTE